MGRACAFVLLLAACGAAQRDFSHTCRTPEGATDARYLVFYEESGSGLGLESDHGVGVGETCRETAFERTGEDFVRQLATAGCLGEDAQPSDWTVRGVAGENNRSSFSGVVETADALHFLSHQTVGGMPSGALSRQEWVIVIRTKGKPIVDCTSVTDLGPYDGPMPP